MPDTALTKVEKALVALLEAETELDDWRIVDDPDLAIDQRGESRKAVLVAAAGFEVSPSTCHGQDMHRATLELAFFSGPQVFGIVNRANLEAIAHAHAAVFADKSLGGRLQDLEATSVQPVTDEVKDVQAATLQYAVEFYTPRGDWFTLVGASGATF